MNEPIDIFITNIKQQQIIIEELLKSFNAYQKVLNQLKEANDQILLSQ